MSAQQPKYDANVEMGLSEVGANENQWNYDVKDLKEEVPEAFDPFGSEETAEVQYKTLEWWYVVLVRSHDRINTDF